MDSMTDMSVGVMAVVGLVLLLVVAVGLYVGFRVMGGRAHQDHQPPDGRPDQSSRGRRQRRRRVQR